MRKIAFIFTGQGAQKLGMGKDYYENVPLYKKAFDNYSKAINKDLVSLCFEDGEKLKLTENTQPCIVAMELAILEVLKSKNILPFATAGFSLGEYSALVSSGAFSDIDALKIVEKRGKYMEDACSAGLGGMTAVIGLDSKTIQSVLDKADGVWLANLNCPTRNTITGSKEALIKIESTLIAAGAKRVIPLRVSGPFHSPLIKKASKNLSDYLLSLEINNIKIPYYPNVIGEKNTDKTQVKNYLVNQIVSPVYWEKTITNMVKDGVEFFVEIGPGSTLQGFCNIIDERLVCYKTDTLKDLEEF